MKEQVQVIELDKTKKYMLIFPNDFSASEFSAVVEKLNKDGYTNIIAFLEKSGIKFEELSK